MMTRRSDIPRRGGIRDCDEGYRRVPYQDFKFEFVAGRDSEWRMSRPEVLQWLARHGITLEQDGHA